MSDPDWQQAVLHELGGTGSGLTDPSLPTPLETDVLQPPGPGPSQSSGPGLLQPPGPGLLQAADSSTTGGHRTASGSTGARPLRAAFSAPASAEPTHTAPDRPFVPADATTPDDVVPPTTPEDIGPQVMARGAVPQGTVPHGAVPHGAVQQGAAVQQGVVPPTAPEDLAGVPLAAEGPLVLPTPVPLPEAAALPSAPWLVDPPTTPDRPGQVAAGAPVAPAPRGPVAPPVVPAGRPQRRASFLRRLADGLRGLLGGSGSASRGSRAADELAERLRRPVPSCRLLAVSGILDCAGKTTVAALLADTIAAHRTDRVLAVDAAGLGPSSLAPRLNAHEGRLSAPGQGSAIQPGARSAAGGASGGAWGDAVRLLAPADQRLWVLSSANGGELELPVFQSAVGGISRHCAVAVVDCGTGMVTELQRGVLTVAHGHVLVVPSTTDAAVRAREALGELARSGFESILSRTIVALVTQSPLVGADAGQARRLLGEAGLNVVQIPYDRHLAAGTAIAMNKLNAATRTAISRIAADALFPGPSGGGT